MDQGIATVFKVVTTREVIKIPMTDISLLLIEALVKMRTHINQIELNPMNVLEVS